MTITVLTDTPGSWFIPYGEQLVANFNERGHDAVYVFNKNDVREGDVCFLLSCNRIVPKRILDLNQHNIVVHGSDLPLGKGFTPMKWQVLHGENDIPLTLFEAVEAVDAGPWYIKDTVHTQGHELLSQIRDLVARKVIELALRFVSEYNSMQPHDQQGEESFYPRMKDGDDRIDPEKSIKTYVISLT